MTRGIRLSALLIVLAVLCTTGMQKLYGVVCFICDCKVVDVWAACVYDNDYGTEWLIPQAVSGIRGFGPNPGNFTCDPRMSANTQYRPVWNLGICDETCGLIQLGTYGDPIGDWAFFDRCYCGQAG